MYATFY
jgi:hypothetical protein